MPKRKRGPKHWSGGEIAMTPYEGPPGPSEPRDYAIESQEMNAKRLADLAWVHRAAEDPPTAIGPVAEATSESVCSSCLRTIWLGARVRRVRYYNGSEGTAHADCNEVAEHLDAYEAAHPDEDF